MSVRLFVPAVNRVAAALTAATCLALGARPPAAGQDPPQNPPKIRFESRVDLVSVTATVVDESGHFVRGLDKDDFVVFEDGKPQPISLFFNERVPVSLGVALDTSGSMQGEKFGVARDALDRFLGELLDPDDEIFLYRFDDDVQLLQGWTTNRTLLRRALGRISPRGATALYDAVADAVPLAETGKHRKKALVLITDGNDTTSHTTVLDLKRLLRDSAVLIYAIGIDSQAEPTSTIRPPRVPFPYPPPIPGRGGASPFPPGRGPVLPPSPPAGPNPASPLPDARVNTAALRDLTDDSGGRTEIIRTVFDLDPATAGVADELSRQYYLGYQTPSAGDGKWHSLRVEVRHGDYRVRARSGFTATSPSTGDKRPQRP
jgi:VWFA-related protein